LTIFSLFSQLSAEVANDHFFFSLKYKKPNTAKELKKEK